MLLVYSKTKINNDNNDNRNIHIRISDLILMNIQQIDIYYILILLIPLTISYSFLLPLCYALFEVLVLLQQL